MGYKANISLYVSKQICMSVCNHTNIGYFNNPDCAAFFILHNTVILIVDIIYMHTCIHMCFMYYCDTTYIC